MRNVARRRPTLDEEESRVWRAFVDGSELVRDRIDREVQRSTAVPAGYARILVALAEAPDRRMRMGDLANATLSSPSRLSHAVGKLEAAGLVERTACGADGRGLHAVLTDAGHTAASSTLPAAAGAVREHFLDLLDDHELAVVGAVFSRIREHLGAEASIDAGCCGDDGACSG